MTRHVKQYQDKVVPGQLEFTDESPKALVKRLDSLGYKRCLLVGGSEIGHSFLKAKLIDQLLLTIEPYLFGTGTQFLPDKTINVKLKLLKIKQLNKNGTLLLSYKIN